MMDPDLEKRLLKKNTNDTTFRVTSHPVDPWGGPPTEEQSLYSEAYERKGSYTDKSYNNQGSLNTDVFRAQQTTTAPPPAASFGPTFGKAGYTIEEEPDYDGHQMYASGVTSYDGLSAQHDPYRDMIFPPPESTGGFPRGAQPANSGGLFDEPIMVTEPGQVKSGELPPGGEWYDTHIFTPSMGAVFFKPQDLLESIYVHGDERIVKGLEDRPVVAFIVEGSSARSAGIELGHVLLKVNGVEVRNPREASRAIRDGGRPLCLLFYVPDIDITISEGEHMVKYDSGDTTAPNSAKDWKPKYVVIGGIIAEPWMMMMFKSKSEYDIAVIETQARRPISVKVKQISLQGARIQNDWQGPQMVKYKNKPFPWKYIVVLPVSRNPVKLSSPNLSQLKPIHEAIRRVLLAQQRDGGPLSRDVGVGSKRLGSKKVDPFTT